MRHFLRMFLSEKTAFVLAVWIAILAGAAIVLLGIYARYYFVAILIAWYVYTNFQQWQYYRQHGFPGD